MTPFFARRRASRIAPSRPPSRTRRRCFWRGAQGDQAAFDALVPLVHDELHQIARRHMAKERRGHSLQATALVNEAYLRLIEVNRMKLQNRAHFFAMAARVMRRILVNAALARRYQKRGGGAQRVTLDEGLAVSLRAAAGRGRLGRGADRFWPQLSSARRRWWSCGSSEA